MSDTAPSHIDEQLIAFLRRTADSHGKPIDAIDPTARFFDLGILDSLSLLDFIGFIERRYGLEIDGKDIIPENFESLAAVGEYLQKRLGAAAGR